MSQRLLSRSPDLKRLRDEGYDLSIKDGHLLVKDVPYANANREAKRGVLVSKLDIAINSAGEEVAAQPSTHVAMFEGDLPYGPDGNVYRQYNGAAGVQIGALQVQHSFSSKPLRGHYLDYYEKVTTYVAELSAAAQKIDPSLTAQTYPVVELEEDDSVFQYMDTASSRAGISSITKKLENLKIAIVGLGGTGSYVLDQVAKTPVREIHLFDGDVFLPHNAFRAPAAPSRDDLKAKPNKVTYLHGIYSRMHRHIVPHAYPIDQNTVGELAGMQFVFLCVDKGAIKELIVGDLEQQRIPFVDVGMGVYAKNDSLYGVLRVATGTPTSYAVLRQHARVPSSDGAEDEYSSNIQIADLNALNAMLAVVKWKKLFGFYGDLEHEHFSTYTLDGNTVTNEDAA